MALAVVKAACTLALRVEMENTIVEAVAVVLAVPMA
jgi:hypothetical protein